MFKPRKKARSKWVETTEAVAASGVWTHPRLVTDEKYVRESERRSLPFKKTSQVRIVTVEEESGRFLVPTLTEQAALTSLPEFSDTANLGKDVLHKEILALLDTDEAKDEEKDENRTMRVVVRVGADFEVQEVPRSALPDAINLPTFDDLDKFKADYELSVPPPHKECAWYRGIWIAQEEKVSEGDFEAFYQTKIQDVISENPGTNLAQGLFYCLPLGRAELGRAERDRADFERIELEHLVNVDDFSNNYLTGEQRKVLKKTFRDLELSKTIKKFLVLTDGFSAIFATADNIVQRTTRGEEKNLLKKAVPGLKAWTFRQLIYWVMDLPTLHTKIVDQFFEGVAIGARFLQHQTLDTMIMYWDGARFNLIFADEHYADNSKWRSDFKKLDKSASNESLLLDSEFETGRRFVKIGKSKASEARIPIVDWNLIVIKAGIDHESVNFDYKLGSGTFGSVFAVGDDKALKMTVGYDPVAPPSKKPTRPAAAATNQTDEDIGEGAEEPIESRNLHADSIENVTKEVDRARDFGDKDIGPKVHAHGLYSFLHGRAVVGYILMDKMDGRLFEVVHNANPPESGRWGQQVFELLVKVANTGNFCFDLHAGNCMVKLEGGRISIVRLIDFGLCDAVKPTEEHSRVKRSGRQVLAKITAKFRTNEKKRQEACLAIMMIQLMSYLQIEQYHVQYSPGVAVLLEKFAEVIRSSGLTEAIVNELLTTKNEFLTGLVGNRKIDGKYGARLHFKSRQEFVHEIVSNTQKYIDINYNRFVDASNEGAEETLQLGTIEPARTIAKKLAQTILNHAASSMLPVDEPRKLGPEIGSGRSATVFKVGEDLAIKLTKLQGNGEVERWTQEYEAANLFGLEKVAPKVFSSGVYEGKERYGYLVMEKMDEILVKAITAHRGLPGWDQQVIHILKTIAENDYFVRDMHSPNWMVTFKTVRGKKKLDKVRIIDFGFTAIVKEKPGDRTKVVINGGDFPVEISHLVLNIFGLVTFLSNWDVNSRGSVTQPALGVTKLLLELKMQLAKLKKHPSSFRLAQDRLIDSHFLTHGIINQRGGVGYGSKREFTSVGEYVTALFTDGGIDQMIKNVLGTS